MASGWWLAVEVTGLRFVGKCRSIIVFVLLFLYVVPAYAAEQPYVSADAAVLMDARTGQVLFAKNPHKKRPPASTTKIMTALLALELGNPDDIVDISPEAARVEGSSIYLTAGERFKFSDLVIGALIKSGNDACAAIAEHIGGSIERFAEMMNEKAFLIGARNTNFVNPHGLPAKEHYTTAYDLGVIAVQALRNAKFAEIVSTRERIIEGNWNRRLTNTNELLWRYHWADGVKTGTTNEAGQCLISSASKDSRRLVAVVLKSYNRYGDSLKLLEYGFANFEHRQVAVAGEVLRSVPVYNGMADRIPVKFTGDLSVLIPKDRPEALQIKSEIISGLTAPVQKGQPAGSIKVYLDGRLMGKSQMVTAAEVPERTWWRIFKKWWAEKKFKGFLSEFTNYEKCA